MLTGIKAVIFDLDGTIIDSMGMWKDIDVEYLGKHKIEMPEDLQRSIEGRSFYETAVYFKNRFNIKDSIDEIMDDWNKMAYEMYTSVVPLKPNIIKFLEFLKKNNYKVGIGTSNSLILTQAILESKGIDKYFDSICTGCNSGAGKPAPDIYLNAASNLGVNPSECIVFEDLVQGIQAGINAGMRTVAVKDDFSEYQIEEKLKIADYYIEDYEEVILGNYKKLR